MAHHDPHIHPDDDVSRALTGLDPGGDGPLDLFDAEDALEEVEDAFEAVNEAASAYASLPEPGVDAGQDSTAAEDAAPAAVAMGEVSTIEELDAALEQNARALADDGGSLSPFDAVLEEVLATHDPGAAASAPAALAVASPPAASGEAGARRAGEPQLAHAATPGGADGAPAATAVASGPPPVAPVAPSAPAARPAPPPAPAASSPPPKPAQGRQTSSASPAASLTRSSSAGLAIASSPEHSKRPHGSLSQFFAVRWLVSACYGLLCVVNLPLRVLPGPRRAYADWLAISLAFWAPIVWLLAFFLARR